MVTGSSPEKDWSLSAARPISGAFQQACKYQAQKKTTFHASQARKTADFPEKTKQKQNSNHILAPP